MLHECPHCGSKNVDYATRIIGYLKRVSNFSQVRQEEAAKRAYAHYWDEEDAKLSD
jgi:ribonucleoside-triphosphate reductase